MLGGGRASALAEGLCDEHAALPGAVTNSLSCIFLSLHLRPETPRMLVQTSWPGVMADISLVFV